MKLFVKYNRINILASILVFLAGCLAFYFVMDYVLDRQLDETLETEYEEITQYVRQQNKLPEIVNTNDQQVFFTEVPELLQHKTYYSKNIWNQNEQEKEWMWQLTFGIAVLDKNYQVTVNKSQQKKEEFLQLIAMIAAGMIFLILVAGYMINRIVLKNLWQPFYYSVLEIRSYQLGRRQTPNLSPTDIDEFTLLNNAFNDMTARTEQDYQALKSFTGNAAHEMQTPVAIISTHTESLMQDEAVLQKHHASVSMIEAATKRLSRLNQSLLLLTKIENRFFEMKENVQWDQLVQQRIQELHELTASQKITVTQTTVPVTTFFHLHLADIVIGNLLNNAIRYNYEGGSIHIQLDGTKLSVVNTSAIPMLDEEQVFNRFYRHAETKAEGSGLGLSIIKQICHIAGYTLQYQYHNNTHIFSILF